MSKKQVLSTIVLVAAAIYGTIYYYFLWDCVIYGKYGSGTGLAYSPNRQYYVIRYISRFNAEFNSDPPGTVKLYARDGSFISSGHAMVGEQSGPEWYGSECFGAAIGYGVLFVDAGINAGWSYKLPTPPGWAEPVPTCPSERVSEGEASRPPAQ